MVVDALDHAAIAVAPGGPAEMVPGKECWERGLQRATRMGGGRE
jgi:hypothetical protein